MKFCSLYSGSSGNSIFVGSEKAKILIDAGLPGKKIDEALKHIGQNPSEIDGIFITHEHIDHIKGVGVLSRKYDIPIYAPHDTWVAMENIIGKIKEHNIKVMDRRSTISIKDIDVKSINVSHTPSNQEFPRFEPRRKKVKTVEDDPLFDEDKAKRVLRRFVELHPHAIKEKTEIEVVLWDERCTTVSAHTALNYTDTRGKKRKNVVDAVAAVIILEDYLSFRKNQK